MTVKKCITNPSAISLMPFMLFFLVTLTGCSPHPGAGNWKVEGSNPLNVSRINIIYEGTADFYVDGKEEAIRRCFWSAIGENTMQLQCVYADDTEKKVSYQFIVTEKGHADLLLDDKVIGQFLAQAPEQAAEKKK